MPMTGRVALPVAINCSAVLGLITGDGKPDADVAGLAINRVLGIRHAGDRRVHPITRHAISSNGPPELPGLMAASVWMALMNEAVESLAPAHRHRAVQRADNATG